MSETKIELNRVSEQNEYMLRRKADMKLKHRDEIAEIQLKSMNSGNRASSPARTDSLAIIEESRENHKTQSNSIKQKINEIRNFAKENRVMLDQTNNENEDLENEMKTIQCEIDILEHSPDLYVDPQSTEGLMIQLLKESDIQLKESIETIQKQKNKSVDLDEQIIKYQAKLSKLE